MTQTELSTCFTTYYKTLLHYTKSQLQQANKKLDEHIVLSECYIHLHKYKDDINDENTVLVYSKKFIRTNIGWYNSVINNETKKNKLYDSIEASSTLEASTTMYDSEWIETQFNQFYLTLNNYDKGLYRIYFERHKTTTPLIAEHLNISRSSAYNTLCECKNLEHQFKNYIKKQL